MPGRLLHIANFERSGVSSPDHVRDPRKPSRMFAFPSAQRTPALRGNHAGTRRLLIAMSVELAGLLLVAVGWALRNVVRHYPQHRACKAAPRTAIAGTAPIATGREPEGEMPLSPGRAPSASIGFRRVMLWMH